MSEVAVNWWADSLVGPESWVKNTHGMVALVVHELPLVVSSAESELGLEFVCRKSSLSLHNRIGSDMFCLAAGVCQNELRS